MMLYSPGKQPNKSESQGGYNMNAQQKGIILTLLKVDKINSSYTNHYWFSYNDFLDPSDNFTDFSCERLDGKRAYIALIENLLSKDETAKIFVQVYGFEDDNVQYIYADTLIIFSKLPLIKIKQIFNAPKDIFPSDIGEKTDFAHSTFLIGDNGKLIPSTELLSEDFFVYYCWWD